MSTGSTSYMSEGFVEGLLRKSVPQQRLCYALSERAVLVHIRSMYIQYKKRNRNGDPMTSCSTAILAVKNILQIVHLEH